MLTPIVTKDMKLFPTQPLPANKNVRYRAKSLQEFANKRNIRVYNGTLSPPKAALVEGGTLLKVVGGKNTVISHSGSATLLSSQQNPSSNTLPTSAQNGVMFGAAVVGAIGAAPFPCTSSSTSLFQLGMAGGKQLSSIIEGKEMPSSALSLDPTKISGHNHHKHKKVLMEQQHHSAHHHQPQSAGGVGRLAMSTTSTNPSSSSDMHYHRKNLGAGRRHSSHQLLKDKLLAQSGTAPQQGCLRANSCKSDDVNLYKTKPLKASKSRSKTNTTNNIPESGGMNKCNRKEKSKDDGEQNESAPSGGLIKWLKNSCRMK